MNSKATWPILLSLSISLTTAAKIVVDEALDRQAESKNLAIAEQALSGITSRQAKLASANFSQAGGEVAPQSDTNIDDQPPVPSTNDVAEEAGPIIHTVASSVASRAATEAQEPDIYDSEKSPANTTSAIAPQALASKTSAVAPRPQAIAAAPKPQVTSTSTPAIKSPAYVAIAAAPKSPTHTTSVIAPKPQAISTSIPAANSPANITSAIIPAQKTISSLPQANPLVAVKNNKTEIEKLLAEKAGAEAAALKTKQVELAAVKQLDAEKAYAKKLQESKESVEKAANEKIAAMQRDYAAKLALIQKDANEQIASVPKAEMAKQRASVQLVKETAKTDLQTLVPTEHPKRVSTKGFDGLWPIESKNHRVVGGNTDSVPIEEMTTSELSSVSKLQTGFVPVGLNDVHDSGMDPTVLLLVEEIEASGGKNTNRIATKVSNLADKWLASGQEDKAEMVYQQALAAYEKVGGLNNLAAASLLNNLATFYFSQRRYFEAGHMYQLSLQTFQKLYPPDHQYVSAGLHNLVTALAKEKRNNEAEAWCKRIITARENKLGRDSLAVAGGEYELATLYLTEHKYNDAEYLLQHSLTIRWRQLGNSHPDVIAATNAYQKLLHETNRADEADALDVRALANRQSAPIY